MCPTNDGVEDTEHFSLHCPSFDEERRDLLAGASHYCDHMDIKQVSSNKFPTELLLYDDKSLSNDVNRDILQLTFNN